MNQNFIIAPVCTTRTVEEEAMPEAATRGCQRVQQHCVQEAATRRSPRRRHCSAIDCLSVVAITTFSVAAASNTVACCSSCVCM